jgi:Protein of unknown function (DUF3575)
MLHDRSPRHLSPFVIILTMLACGAAIRAQAAEPDAPALPTQSISANPFTLMFQWFNADYERRIAPNVTWDASGSFFSIDGFGYKNANVALKYYPRESMSGFYVGGRTGIYRVSADVRDGTNGASVGANFYGAGFEVGYNWLLGKRDQVVVGMGAGVTRLFGGELSGVSLTVPTIRLISLGYAF